MIDAAGLVGSEGERSSSMPSIPGPAAGAGPLAPGQRWSLARKYEVVLRLLRGEPVEAVSRLRFEETRPGSALTWHPAPERQYVVTLSGTLDFETRDGTRFRLGPGDVLLAEDTAGGGHRWRLVDDQPWRRVYIAF